MSHIIIRGTLLAADAKIDWIAQELKELIAQDEKAASPVASGYYVNSAVCPIYYGDALLGIANVEILLGAVTFTGYVRYDHPVRLDLQINEKFWSTCDYFVYCSKDKKTIQVLSINLTKEDKKTEPVTLEML